MPASNRTWSLPLPVQPWATVVGAVLLGGGDEVLDDRRPGEGGDQRVAVHVEGVGLDRREAVLVGELVLGVRDLGLDGTAGERALADDVQVLAALADVDGDGDDLGARLLGDPADGDGGVQTARVGEYDALGHGFLLTVHSLICMSMQELCMIRQSRAPDRPTGIFAERLNTRNRFPVSPAERRRRVHVRRTGRPTPRVHPRPE